MRIAGLPWDGNWKSLMNIAEEGRHLLSESAVERITLHRVNLMRSINRTEKFRSGFPERIIAAGMGLSVIESFELSPEEEIMLADLESRFFPTRISGTAASIMLGIGFLLSLILSGFGVKTIKKKRWIENIPTVKTRSVVYGLNEIKGEVVLPENIEALKGPLSGESCCYYHYLVQEKRGSGKNSKWVTITDDKMQLPFLCRDDEGEIEVVPDGAEIILNTKTKKREGSRSYSEHRLPIGAEAYVLGTALVNQKTHDSLVIMKSDDETLPYILSDLPEEEIIQKKATKGFILLNLGMNAFMLAGFSLAGYLGGFGAVSYMSAAMIPVIYLVLFMIVLMYNDLVFLIRRCDSMRANIDVALKKRFDLLPNLVDSVKAYLAHEKDVQEKIGMLRSGGPAITPAEAGRMMEAGNSVMRQIEGAIENYPDLKGNELIGDLMKNLRDLEDDIAFMRAGYNHAVEIYNTRIQRIPDVILAKMFGFKAQGFFR